MVRFNHCLINIVNICEIKHLKMIIEFFFWGGGGGGYGIGVYNATFNNISVISWRKYFGKV